MNYLGTVGEATPLSAAACLCNPFNLTVSAANWERGFNQIYDRNLAKAMRKMVVRNAKVWNAAGIRLRVGSAASAKTVRQWDNAITRVSFGALPRLLTCRSDVCDTEVVSWQPGLARIELRMKRMFPFGSFCGPYCPRLLGMLILLHWPAPATLCSCRL